jgi:hypothetical protein
MNPDMRRSSSSPHASIPGGRLLALAARLFEHPAQLDAARAVVADLQHEVEEAGTSRWRGARARLRGYLAFWHVVVVVPLALPASGPPGRMPLLISGSTRQNVFSYVVVGMWVALWLALWPVFGPLSLVALGTGFAVAVALHRWYDRHPEFDTVDNVIRFPSRPEINLSRIQVGGDIGGLFFVVGSVVTVLIGLSPVRQFALAAMVCGIVLSVPLFLWRSSHPSRPTSIRRR